MARKILHTKLKIRSKFNWHFHVLPYRVMFYVYIPSLQEISGLIKVRGHLLPFASYHVAPWFTLSLQEVTEINSCHALRRETMRQNECQVLIVCWPRKHGRTQGASGVDNFYIYKTYSHAFNQNLTEQRCTDSDALWVWCFRKYGLEYPNCLFLKEYPIFS